MRWFMLSAMIVLALGGWEARSLGAARAEFVPPMPKDFDKVDFYFQTVGIGSELYMIGGHSLIRVIDRSNSLDVVYNWGVFDFSDPWFLFNFIKGHLIYRMDAYSMRGVLRTYRIEKRALWQEKLNLTKTK